MKKISLYFILLITLSYLLASCKQSDNKEVVIKEEWKNGIVFVNDKPEYFDFTRFGNGFFASEEWIKRHSGKLIVSVKLTGNFNHFSS